MQIYVEKLYQWDLNRKVKIYSCANEIIDEIHFRHPTDNCALVVEYKNGEVDIPNVLLQHKRDIHMYIVYADQTQSDHVFKVTPRQKPADYVYTETEVLSYKMLDERIKALEEGGSEVSEEDISKAVESYLEEHPIEAGATKEQARQIEKNAEDISNLSKENANHNDDKTIHVTSTEKETWNAKSDFSGSYNDLTDKPTIPTVPVQSVNGKTGAVQLSASDVGADASGTAQTKVSEHNTSEESHSDIRLLITNLTTRINGILDSEDVDLDQLSELVAYIKSNRSLIEEVTTNKVNVSDIIDNLTTSVSNKPLSAKQGVVLKGLIDAIVIPTKTSQLTNDSGFLTEHQDLSEYAKQADVDTLEQEIKDLKANETVIPDYWEEYLAEKIEIIKALQEESGADASAFIYFSDSHDVSTQYSSLLADKIMKECSINHVFFLGDATKYSASDESDSKASIKRVIEALKKNSNMIVTRGNHDGAYGTYDENFMDKNKLYANYNIVNGGKADEYGEENTYCYVDDKAEKTRYIILDTYDYPNISARPESVFMGLRQTQYNWLIEALNVQEGWSIVVLTHIPPITEYYNDSNKELRPERAPLKHLAYLLGAYKDKTSYSASFGGVQGDTASIGGYTNLYSGHTQDSSNNRWYTNWIPYDQTDNDGTGTMFHIKNSPATTEPYRLHFAQDENGTNASELFYCTSANVKGRVASDYDDSVVLIQHNTGNNTYSYCRFEFKTVEPTEDLIITANEQIIEASEGDCWDALSIDVDFTTYKGEFIGLFAGHMHNDYRYTQADGYGCDCTVICADGRGLDSRSYNNETTYPEYGGRAIGTVYEQAFDVVIVNKATKEVKTVRIGAGDQHGNSISESANTEQNCNKYFTY